MKVELFQQDRLGKTKTWVAESTQNQVVVTWGQVGGQMQETVQTFNEGVNIGQSNEKTPEEVAQSWLERQVLLRRRKGYSETGSTPTAIDIFTRPPSNLRFFKPQNSLSASLAKSLEAGGAIALRKRDGAMHMLLIDAEGQPHLYSSSMAIGHKDEPGVPWLDRFPLLREDLEKRLYLPPKTILLGEMCTSENYKDKEGFDVDNFEYVGSVLRSLTERAVKTQREKGWLSFCVWDVAFWDGRCLLQEQAATVRFASLSIFSPKRTKALTCPEIIQVNHVNHTLVIHSPNVDHEVVIPLKQSVQDPVRHTLLTVAKQRHWEGYVVVDLESMYDDRAYNFRGKAERPLTVGKLKPKFEADFIARFDPDKGVGTWGKGKKSGGVGSLALYLLGPAGETFISNCGGGLTDDLVRDLTAVTYPIVVQVEFDSWTKEGSLRYPEFIRVRGDKAVTDCTLDQRQAQITNQEE